MLQKTLLNMMFFFLGKVGLDCFFFNTTIPLRNTLENDVRDALFLAMVGLRLQNEQRETALVFLFDKHLKGCVGQNMVLF